MINKQTNSSSIQTFLFCIAVLGAIAGCDAGDSVAKARTKAKSTQTANAATTSSAELSSRQVHPLLELKSARFGPCQKSNTIWKVPRGDHELRLTFSKPANEKAKEVVDRIVDGYLVDPHGRRIHLPLKGDVRKKDGRLVITTSALIPGVYKEQPPFELLIESFVGDGGPAVVFSKKFQIIPQTVQPPAKPFAKIDGSRLRFPPGWNGFEAKVGSGLKEEAIPELLESARSYIDSPARPHPHDLNKIGMAFIKSASLKLKLGKPEEALTILEELQQHGGVLYDVLEQKDFDDLRDDPRFKAVYEFGKAETNAEFYGRYLVRQPPLLTLKDFEALELSPPLPDLSGKAFVISTGGPHMFDAKPLEEALKCGVAVHAIVTKDADLKLPEGVTVHESSLSNRSLVIDGTPIIWFGGKDGNVVAFLRPFSGSEMATSIVENLKNSESAISD